MNDHAGEHDHEAGENDQRGDEAVHAPFGQTVGQRIEHVGKRRAGHEGQEHMMQKPQQADQDQKGGDPERHVPLNPHGPPEQMTLVPGSDRVHVAEPLGEIEGDREQRQDGDQPDGYL